MWRPPGRLPSSAAHHRHRRELLVRRSVLSVVGVIPGLGGDREPGLCRVGPLVASPRRDIWLVVHPDLQHNARVRATLHFLTELIQRERPLLSGEGRPAPRASGRKSS